MSPVPVPAGPFVPAGSVRIFDTTLRDGEQAPGAGLTAAEKLEVARQLVRLKVDVIEAGFPAASPGDWEAVHRIAQEAKGVAVAALARCRDGDPAARGGGDQGRRAAPPPRLHRHLGHPPQAQAQAVPRRGARRGCPLGPLRARAAGPRRRDRVLGRGRVAHRPRVPAPGLRGGRDGRGHHRQHPGHGRLRDPGRVRGAGRAGPRPRRRRGHGLGPLPQRPGPRHRQHAGGRPGRRAPGGGDDQRPRRAGRQRVAGGGRHGPPHAPDPVPGARQPGPDRADHGGQPAGQPPDRVRDPAQQGRRRRQRLRPRERDPPGRRDQEPADLRDHDPPVGGALRQPAHDRQAVGAQGAPEEAPRPGPRRLGRRPRRRLPRGDRAGRPEEGGHRRRPPGARPAALRRHPGVDGPRRLERHLVARRPIHGHASA